MDVEVQDVAAELWAKQLGSGRGGAAGRAHWSAAELAEDDGGRNVERWRGEWRVWGVQAVRGDLRASSKLTGRVAVDVRPIGGRTRGGGWRPDQTERGDSVAVDNDWNRFFIDVLLTIHSVVLARICSNG